MVEANSKNKKFWIQQELSVKLITNDRGKKLENVASKPSFSLARHIATKACFWPNAAFSNVMRNKWMINEIRLLLAVLLFCLGVYLVWDLFAAGFDFIVLVSSLLCFIAAHYIKPKSSDRDDSSAAWDIVDFIVDIPFKTISIFLRAISKPFKGDVDGFDL